MWASCGAESCQDIVVSWQPHKYTTQTHDTAASICYLHTLSIFMWHEVRGSGICCPCLVLHGLFSYCVNLALSRHFIKCTDLHPISLAWKKSYLYEAYLIHFCSGGVDSIVWRLLTSVVDSLFLRKRINHTGDKQKTTSKDTPTQRLFLQTTHAEKEIMLCPVKKKHISFLTLSRGKTHF